MEMQETLSVASNNTIERELSSHAAWVLDKYNQELNDRLSKNEGFFEGKSKGDFEIEKFWGINFSIFRLFEAQEQWAKRKTKKAMSIQEVTPLYPKVIEHFYFEVEYNPTTKKIIDYDTTGLYRIDFNDGDFIYLAQWVTGDGRETVADGVIAGTFDGYIKLKQALNKQEEIKSVIKKGAYRLGEKNGKPIYSKLTEIQSTEVVHPEKEKSLGYIEDFFENLEQYTSDGKKGTRKCMWIGPAGTGKTSISRQILREYGKTICVCITTDLKACYLHMVKAAKSKRPTIIILEDAEKSLQGANSDVLNVLDGVDLPRNVAGTYIIMTTNKPNMIEKRILKRPGRIDEYCFWGMLYDEDALKCAKLYFKDSLYQNKTDEEIIMIDAELLVIVSNEGKGMSGAQIQNLAESMVSYSKSRGVKITTELIKEAKQEIEDNLAKIEKMSDEQGLLKEDSMGFNLGERKEESAGFRTY